MIIAARVLVILILLFAPWAFGTTERWSLITVEILTATAAFLALLGYRYTSVVAQKGVLWNWSWGAPMLALVVYMTIQALNASYRYQDATQSLIPLHHVSWLPHSVDVATTWQTVAKFLTYIAFFWTVRVCFVDSTQTRLLLSVVVVSGFVMALLAILQKLTGTTDLLWVRTPKSGGSIFGPFVCRNNYAAYMNLMIPLCPALARVWKHEAVRKRQKSHPGYIAYIMAAVMITSVFLSESRGGMVVCAGLIAVWLLIEFATTMRFSRLVIGLLFCFLTGAVLAYLGREAIQKRLATLEDLPRLVSDRQTVASLALQVFHDHPVFGTGAGTFVRIFPFYQPASIAGFYNYAHNDWIQYLTEFGSVGTALLFAFGLGALWPFVGQAARLFRGSDSLNGIAYICVALVLALAGVGLHALIDFPLHIPAIGLTVVTFFALITVRTPERLNLSTSEPLNL